MDGLELNLFKSENAGPKKKKTVSKSKKKFLKKKLHLSKRGSKDKPKIRKKPADKKEKKEINQNKEISTIQDEFSSGLEVKKPAKKPVEVQKKNVQKREDAGKRPIPKTPRAQRAAKNNLKASKATSDSSNTKKEHQENQTNKKTVESANDPTEPSSSSTRPTNNLAISMINDEFSDGLTDLQAPKSLKRKFNEDEEHGSAARQPKKFNRHNDQQGDHRGDRRSDHQSDRRSDHRSDRRSDHRGDRLSDRRSERPHQRSSHQPSADDLKSDFNRMFSSKGKMERLEERPNRPGRAGGKFEKSEHRRDEQPARDRNEFISNCFASNPEIPEVRLRNLAEEAREGVFRAEDESFDTLKDRIHPHLIACLAARQGITKMTNVQSKSIPVILDGSDCLIKSVTGSGKTLAYIVPIIQRLQQKTPKISRNDGIYALIIVPTRELVMQCYSILESLCKAFTFIVPSYLMGGENKHSEKNRIRKGINILVSTPGRLLDHIATTKNMNLSRVEMLVIDEADRMYEAGFEESIQNILQFIREQKEEEESAVEHIQTVLLSATLSSGVRNLAGIVLNDPQLIDTYDEEVRQPDGKLTFPKNLKQYFCLVPAKLRLLTLASFIFKNCSFEKSSKLLIFMSTQDQVDFHHTLFGQTFNAIIKENGQDEIEFFKLHGSMEQKERMKIFQQFKDTATGVLLCTDVASRGLDLKEIEFVVQYSCPSTIEDYVHRSGRTARIEHAGSSLIFLLPSESNFLKHIQKQLEANLEAVNAEDVLKVLLSFSFGQARPGKCFREHASQLQYLFENAVHDDEEQLLQEARKAYLSYVRAYASHPRCTRTLLPFKELHLGHLCKSFALRDAPRTLSNFKNEFIKQAKRSENEKFSQKFAKNRTIMNRRMQPIERKVDEFGSGL